MKSRRFENWRSDRAHLSYNRWAMMALDGKSVSKTIRLPITISTTGWSSVHELFGDRPLKEGSTKKVPGGVTLTLKRILRKNPWTAPHTREGIDLIISFGRDVGVGLLASWLYDKLSKGNSEIEIDSTEVRFNRGATTRVIRTRIRKKGRNAD
jgi:hypothetical protein